MHKSIYGMRKTSRMWLPSDYFLPTAWEVVMSGVLWSLSWDWSPSACCSAWRWREDPRSQGEEGRSRICLLRLLPRAAMAVSFRMTWGAPGSSEDQERTLSSRRSSLDSGPGATDFRTSRGVCPQCPIYIVMIRLLMSLLLSSSMSLTIMNVCLVIWLDMYICM